MNDERGFSPLRKKVLNLIKIKYFSYLLLNQTFVQEMLLDHQLVGQGQVHQHEALN